MFKVQDKVFYPKYGVATITQIMTISDTPTPYLTYVMELSSMNGNISLPVDQAQNLGLRALAKPSEIKKALQTLQSKEDLDTIDMNDNWKDRKKDLDQLFLQGDICTSAFLVKILYHKNGFKALGAGERKIYDSALQFLIDELASVENIDAITAEHLIAQSLSLSLDSI